MNKTREKISRFSECFWTSRDSAVRTLSRCPGDARSLPMYSRNYRANNVNVRAPGGGGHWQVDDTNTSQSQFKRKCRIRSVALLFSRQFNYEPGRFAMLLGQVRVSPPPTPAQFKACTPLKTCRVGAFNYIGLAAFCSCDIPFDFRPTNLPTRTRHSTLPSPQQQRAELIRPVHSSTAGSLLVWPVLYTQLRICSEEKNQRSSHPLDTNRFSRNYPNASCSLTAIR